MNWCNLAFHSRTCLLSCVTLTLHPSQEEDFDQAERYADIAMSADRYNPGALNNKGCTVFVKHDYEKAAEFFKEALRNDSSCTEALYNLGTFAFLVLSRDYRIFNNPVCVSVHARFNLQEAEQTGRVVGLLSEAPFHPEEQHRGHVPAGQPVSFTHPPPFIWENVLLSCLQPLTHWLQVRAPGRPPAGDPVADAHHQCEPHRLRRTGQTGTAV